MALISIVLGALATFIIGFLFHGPIAGKLWMKLANIQPTGNEKFSDMKWQMIWNFIANMATAFVLFNLIQFTAPMSGGLTIGKSVLIALWMWAGFIVPSSSIEVIWMKRRPAHWLFECGVSFICFVAMGIIFAL